MIRFLVFGFFLGETFKNFGFVESKVNFSLDYCVAAFITLYIVSEIVSYCIALSREQLRNDLNYIKRQNGDLIQ